MIFIVGCDFTSKSAAKVKHYFMICKQIVFFIKIYSSSFLPSFLRVF